MVQAMITTIYCKTNDTVQDFYMIHNNEEIYLFTQKRKASVERFYASGVNLDKALCHGIGNSNYAIHKTMDKLRLYIRYIEKEYDIILLNKTKKTKHLAA